MDRTVMVNTKYYQQYGLGGWGEKPLPLNLDKTALVVMHAVYVGEQEDSPEYFTSVEYLQRCYEIAAKTFSPLLNAARQNNIKIYHIPMRSGYYESLPGYIRAVNAAEPVVSPQHVATHDDVLRSLYAQRADLVHGAGEGTYAAIAKAKALSDQRYVNFIESARPQGIEPVAVNTEQLAAVAVEDSVNHLIYMGFAVDGCLLVSPGGMVDMARRRFMCSVVSDAVTAIENKESRDTLAHTQMGLWRVGSQYGFVYDSSDLIKAFKKVDK